MRLAQLRLRRMRNFVRSISFDLGKEKNMALGSGSIAFIGFNADGNDGFAFIAVDAIPAGTVIRFSDNEWNGMAPGAGGAFNTGEGSLTWTNDGAEIPAGTLVELHDLSEPDLRGASVGTVSGGSVALGNSGESIFAFVGESETAPTTFLAAVTNNNGGFTGATTSGLLAGTGLVAGETAVVLPRTDGADVAAFDPALGGSSFVTREAALAAINATGNWIAQSGSGNQDADDIVPDAPFLSDPQSPIAGVSFSIGGGNEAPTIASLIADADAKPEGESFSFTVTLDAAVAADTVLTLSATGETGDIVVPATVTVLAGQSSASFTVETVGDAFVESDESFTITATLGLSSQQATATIENDDAPASSVIGGITILEQAQSLQGSVETPVATNSLNVTRVGSYVSGDSEGGAESIAFDASNDRVYVTNAALDRIDILDLSNPRSPTRTGFIDLVATLPGFDYGNVNSVAVRNGLIAVAIQSADGGENGIVALYDGNAGTLIKTLEVGALPDQLTFSPDGSLLIVANEGERYLDLSAEATVDNAPGTVTVISVPANAADAVVRNTIGFSALDAFEAQLDALGIKTLDATQITVGSGALSGTLTIPDSTVSQDIEPEYVAVSPDGTKAYVTLQEVNAVAVIDLTDAAADKPISILPLGYVDFSLIGNEADFSDRDGTGGSASISVGNAPVKGLLQPDAIASFEVAGKTYFITANEGDSRIVQSPTFEDPALNEARASSLTDPDNPDYARVNVDTVWSSAEDLYAFGGRGFSIFRQNDDGTIVKVEETGGDLEQIIAALPNAADIFNSENGGGFDSRSDNKGAEPEGVVAGEVDGVPYAFVALERIGGIMVWDLSNPEDAKFVRYMAPTSDDFGPEVIKFVSAEESPNGRALVLTANEITGSVTVYEASNLISISAVQGSGAASTKVGQTVTVEAIVVGDFQNGDADGGRNLGGFWLQEELVDQDGNPLTSEGIFVSYASLGAEVQIGDRVRVTGTVAESFGNTELNASSVTIVEAGAVEDVNTMAVEIDLPSVGVQGSNGTYTADLEAYEGMLVRFPETLTITEQFNLDQFGEIRLTQGERPNSYTVDNEASVAGYDAHIRDIAARSVVFDDGRSTSNPNLDNTVVDGDYNTATAPRMGDTVTGLTGVLDYDFSQFRVHAVENGPGVNDFVSENPRPTSPPDVGGTLTLASFNVLNYFTTLDNGQNTAIGLEPRGAETAAEFQRQTDKLVNTILELNADVLGLLEIESSFAEGASGNAIQYLVDQLNEVSGSYKYDWVRPGTPFVGGDAIAVGFIYDVTSVRVSFDSEIAILDDSDLSAEFLAQSTLGHVFNGENTSRAALAVTFEELATGGEFTAVVNHFKSKSGTGTGADADIKDGNGGWNSQRTLAAEALAEWLETNPTGNADEDKIILGDLNAYDMEDPMDVLADAGYTDQGAGGYSYVFDGQTGSLDHILTNASASAQVTGVAKWHINADEADALDYQLNFNGDLSTNERDPAIFDAEIIARVSDHDPIVIGLDLTEEPVFTLQLLHLSDGEAGLLAGSTAKNLAALVDAFDDDFANTLILSGGDTFLPGPFLAAGTDPSVIPTLNAVTGSTIAANATVAIGAVDTAIHNEIGVEVSAIGNHEWDLGSNAFAGSFTPGGGWVGADYAMVSANLDVSGDSAINPRFTNTVGNGATPTPLASTLKGRIAPAVVVEKGGEKIGIVGATTQILEAISSPTGTEVKGFPTGPGANGEVDDMALLASQLQPVIDELRAEGINKIILQAHLQNIANEKLLATLLKGVDIILAAGSNTRLGDADDEAVSFPGHAADFADTYPLVIEDAEGNSTLIINTDNEYTYLGRLKVDFDSDGNIIVDNLADDADINGAYASTAENVAEAWGTTVDNLEETAFAEGTQGDQVRDLTDAVQEVISVKDGNVFGFTDVYLEGERAFVRSEETNLGSLSADANAHALRQALGASDEQVIVSFKNGGGIRAQIGTLSAPDPVDGSVDKLPPPANPDADKPAGGVSQLDIENSLRFDNKLMAFDTTAAGLKAILEYGVSAGTLQGRFPQIGGVAFSWDPDLPAGSRVADIALIDGNGRSYALYDDGVVQDNVPATITVVTLNFLADGGDGYPAKAHGENFRYLLADGSLSAPVDEALNFTDPMVIAASTPPGSTLLGEQQSLGEYMEAFHGTQETAYDTADTSVALDERIQNLNFREDTVLENGNEAPEIVENTLSPRLSTSALFATLGSDDLFAVDWDGDALTYTVTTLAAGALLVNGEIPTIGTSFTQADIEAGRVSLLAGAVTPTAIATASVGTAQGSVFTFVDGFGFSLSDGTLQTEGSFTAGYRDFDTVQTAAQWGGYWGGNGDDYQLGTGGTDVMTGGNGADTIIGQGGHDSITGGNGKDRLFGHAGNDVLNGGNGDDLLEGGDGNDVMNANNGDNILLGGAGNDIMNAGNGDDWFFAGDGNDVINANGGNNRINAGAGHDQITAGNGDDTIIAGAGHDQVYANGGDNTFQLGGISGALSDGYDEFWAGNGSDKYALFLHDRAGNDAGWGDDTINGFKIAQGDRLVAFSETAGFWDDPAQLLALAQAGLVSGARSQDGGDLMLTFAGSQAAESSLTLKSFFWDNERDLSAAEKATARGAAISAANLAGILANTVQDGGEYGVSGPDFLNKAHSFIANDFVL
jgi:predicted extracellular nuclease/2',3'-cyclic-nucleotide 2'-phosphodiesterase (5'-nucleotidase family)